MPKRIRSPSAEPKRASARAQRWVPMPDDHHRLAKADRAGGPLEPCESYTCRQRSIPVRLPLHLLPQSEGIDCCGWHRLQQLSSSSSHATTTTPPIMAGTRWWTPSAQPCDGARHLVEVAVPGGAEATRDVVMVGGEEAVQLLCVQTIAPSGNACSCYACRQLKSSI